MPKAKCPTCATVVSYVAGYDPICPSCGFRGTAPAPPVATTPTWIPAPTPGAAAGPAPVPHSQATVQPAGPQQGMAVGAFVCGLVGFAIPPLSLVAVILGAVAMSNADRDPRSHGGKGLAVAGLILGIIVGVFWLLVLGAFGFWEDSW